VILEPESMTLMPAKSPCFSSNTARTHLQSQGKLRVHYSSDEHEPSSSSHKQLQDHKSTISIVPIIHEHSRSRPNENESENHYFATSECQSPVEFRKKIHDIYILPVSPNLSTLSSSSSSIVHSEDHSKIHHSNTMPHRSRKYQTTNRGIENDCFDDSPKPTNRTLPRSHTNTARRIQAPSEPPPLPPTNVQLSVVELEQNSVKIAQPPPPVPCRSQKPSVLPIGFEEIIQQSDQIGFRLMTDNSSPQTDSSEHSWPNPPESMSTSQVSQRLSIPYDHLMPTFIMHQYRHNEHSMLTESDT